MNPAVELVRAGEPARKRSPLAAARLHRQLTVEAAARRAGISADQVTWLEEGRVYRFPSTDDAILAALLYASALGIGNREARGLAGLPVPPVTSEANQRGRLAVVAALAAAVVGLVAVVAAPGRGDDPSAAAAARSTLPPPWRIHVDVLNGSGDFVYTRRVADRILALAYRVDRVTKATRFDYPQTSVYYPPGGEAVARRLGESLGVGTKPLPGGDDPRRLVVIVGPERGPGN